MSVSVKIEGINQASKYLEKKGKMIDEGIANSMPMIAKYMEGEVKTSIAGQRSEPRSVDTGRFMNSVNSRSDRKTAVIFSPVDYALFLEYGSSRMNARRHFNNSLARSHVKIKEYINQNIIKLLKT